MTEQIGPRRMALPVFRPNGFEPEYDAFEPRFNTLDDLVLIIFGIEVRAGEDGGTVHKRLLRELERPDDGPNLLEHGVVREGFGPNSHIWFAYWRDRDTYEQWCAKSDIEALFDDKNLLSGNIGLWRESCHISLDHNETSSSRAQNITGIANLCDALEVTPIHGYWGSARDRIVAAADDSLTAEGRANPLDPSYSLGRRLHIKAPGNVCLIKTTQDLHMANEEQRAIYRCDVEPALLTGLKFLRENSADTGCIGMRFIEEATKSNKAVMRTCGIGYFESLSALEEWTHYHWTHENIMKTFLEMVGRFEGQPGVHLWHEISVFEAGRLTGDYVNCSLDGTLIQSKLIR